MVKHHSLLIKHINKNKIPEEAFIHINLFHYTLNKILRFDWLASDD